MSTKAKDDGSRLKDWLIRNYDLIANFGSAVVSVVYSIIAENVYSLIYDADNDIPIVAIIASVVLGVIIIIIYSAASQWFKKKHITKENHKEFIKNAYLSIQSLSNECQGAYISHMIDQKNPVDANNLSIWAQECIKYSVEYCYEFFINAFGYGQDFINQIEFQVTFMTLSYKDKEITIPFFCNRNRLQPRSMIERKTNPKRYEGTVTDKIYENYEKNSVLSTIIIPDTSSPEFDYKFVYEDQRDTLKSTIVVPVLSRENRLLGTLVVTCNSVGFFSKSDRKFWDEMMRLFTTVIGNYKLILDSCAEEGVKPF